MMNKHQSMPSALGSAMLLLPPARSRARIDAAISVWRHQQDSAGDAGTWQTNMHKAASTAGISVLLLYLTACSATPPAAATWSASPRAFDPVYTQPPADYFPRYNAPPPRYVAPDPPPPPAQGPLQSLSPISPAEASPRPSPPAPLPPVETSSALVPVDPSCGWWDSAHLWGCPR